VRQRADMILVGVREQNRAHRPALEIAEVRQDEVDAEVLVAREREPRVDDEDLPGDLEHRHVLADLAEAAERDHPQHRGRHRQTAYGGNDRVICPQAVGTSSQPVYKSPFRGWHREPSGTRTTCMRTGQNGLRGGWTW